MVKTSDIENRSRHTHADGLIGKKEKKKDPLMLFSDTNDETFGYGLGVCGTLGHLNKWRFTFEWEREKDTERDLDQFGSNSYSY